MSDPIRDALAELVALKDLHDQFDLMKQDVPDFATAAVLEALRADALLLRNIVRNAQTAIAALNPAALGAMAEALHKTQYLRAAMREPKGLTDEELADCGLLSELEPKG